MKHVTFVPFDLCGLKIREDDNGQQSRVVEGRAVVYGQRSVNLTPWSQSRVVYEVLEPGCIPPDLLTRSDVVYNLNHNNNVLNVMGRFRNSERDTLSLDLRTDGVYTRCELPHTNAADDTLELIKRGDISGQSFAFSDDWEDTENGVSLERTNETVDGKEVWLRHVKRITALYDVSIVTHPAYEQTNVATREQSDAIDRAIDEQLKRECGDDDAKKKDEEEEAAKRAAEEEAKKKAEEEAKAKEEQEARELEEQEQRFREQQAMRLRAQHRRREIDLESLEY